MKVIDWLLTGLRKAATLLTSTPEPTQGTTPMNAADKTALLASIAALQQANATEATNLTGLAAAITALPEGGDTTALEAALIDMTNQRDGLQNLVIEVNEKVNDATALAAIAKASATVHLADATAVLDRLQLPLDSQS